MCTKCKGTGVIWFDDGDLGSKWIPCPSCKGVQ